MSEKIKIPMRLVQSMPQYQSRANQALNAEAVDEYAERYKAGEPMGPIQVCGQRHIGLFVVDGHHRFAAMKKAGFGPTTEIEVEVLDSRCDPAVVRWNAAGSNTSHGIRRTRADKRKAVEMVLRDFPMESDVKIASHCGVTRRFVYQMRDEMGIPHSRQSEPAQPEMPQTPLPPPHAEEEKNGNIPIPPPPPPTPQNRTQGDAGQSVPPIPPPQRPQDTPPVPTTPPPPPPSRPETETPQGEENYPWPDGPRPSFAQPEREYKEGAGGHHPWVREKDDTSRYIPPELREFFSRKGELMSVKANLKRIHAQLKAGVEKHDPLWCDIDNGIVEQLGNVIKAVEDCDPLYVCPSCSGLNPGCQLCGNRNGFIGRRQLEIVKKNPALWKYMQRAEKLPPPPMPKEEDTPAAEA